MTDPDSILQLGIEAAREGNKEEARNLFRLLTSEDNENVQGWLWLAGVSESVEERQAALERVIELEPENEMARKSLEALKSSPSASPPTPTEVPASPEVPSPESSASPSPAEDIDDFDDPFSELDSLSDIFAGDSKAVGRSDTPSTAQSSSESAANTSPASDMATASRTTKTSSASRSSSPFGKREEKEKGNKSPMSNNLLSRTTLRIAALIIAVLIMILGLVFVVVPRFFGEPEVAVVPISGSNNGSQPSVDGDGQGQPPANDTNGQADGGTGEGNPDQGVVDMPTATPETPQVAEPPTPPQGPPAAPAPVDGITIIPSNTPLESNGWLYDFNQQVCANSCARQWFGNIGNIQPQGRFVIVLMMVANRSGQDQPVPADFMVLKDAQGRIYNAMPQASTAYVIPGINADASHETAIPANGIATSIALVFDVEPGSTDLVMYSPTKSDQGWRVLSSVQ